MKECFLAAIAFAFGAVTGASTAVQAADAPPAWAYGFTTPVMPREQRHTAYRDFCRRFCRATSKSSDRNNASI
jgi:hypothetical protein